MNERDTTTQSGSSEPARPEYVDFDVDDFPGGLASCLEAILMVADQPQQTADLARVLAVDESRVLSALQALRDEYDGKNTVINSATDKSVTAENATTDDTITDNVTADNTKTDSTGVKNTGSETSTAANIAANTVVSTANNINNRLSQSHAPRGFELRHTARGWQFASRIDFEPVVSAFVTDGQTARLSQAALEALAIIAYKQPITRAQISAIRGVNSDGVVRSLVVRGLVREEGVDPDSRAALLITSGLFLEKMGLDSLDQLPELAPFLPNSAADVDNNSDSDN